MEFQDILQSKETRGILYQKSDTGGQDNPTIFIPHLKLIKTWLLLSHTTKVHFLKKNPKIKIRWWSILCVDTKSLDLFKNPHWWLNWNCVITSFYEATVKKSGCWTCSPFRNIVKKNLLIIQRLQCEAAIFLSLFYWIIICHILCRNVFAVLIIWNERPKTNFFHNLQSFCWNLKVDF